MHKLVYPLDTLPMLILVTLNVGQDSFEDLAKVLQYPTHDM